MMSYNKDRLYAFELSSERVLEILGKALDGEEITPEELAYLAKSRGINENLALFYVARRVCERFFGRKVFLYGFVYFSTYCRNACTFCFYRRANINAPRYRKSLSEILDAVGELVKSGVHLVDLTMGEDPLIHGGDGYDYLLSICREVKKTFDIPLMVSPGVLPRSALAGLSQAGADWYALYQESYNRNLFSKLRPGQDFDQRVIAKLNALREGLLVEDGILLGVGETVQDVINAIFEMKGLGAQQVRVMGFVPQRGTPMENLPPPPILDEMRAIALMRLVHQDRIIPASYDIDGLKGLELRLMAGANAVTSLIPPAKGLAGVAQASLDVDRGLRTVEGVKPYLERLGLEPSDKQTYYKWVEREKERLRKRWVK